MEKAFLKKVAISTLITAFETMEKTTSKSELESFYLRTCGRIEMAFILDLFNVREYRFLTCYAAAMRNELSK